MYKTTEWSGHVTTLFRQSDDRVGSHDKTATISIIGKKEENRKRADTSGWRVSGGFRLRCVQGACKEKHQDQHRCRHLYWRSERRDYSGWRQKRREPGAITRAVLDGTIRQLCKSG